MFLEEKPFDYTMLIVTVICFVIVVAILLFAIVLMIKKRGDNSISKPVQINPKLFRNTLGDFFKAVGGTENVKKIDLDEEKNCLVVQLEEPLKAKELDILCNYNLIKREFFEDRIELYFIDSKSFYNSLFGK